MKDYNLKDLYVRNVYFEDADDTWTGVRLTCWVECSAEDDEDVYIEFYADGYGDEDDNFYADSFDYEKAFVSNGESALIEGEEEDYKSFWDKISHKTWLKYGEFKKKVLDAYYAGTL